MVPEQLTQIIVEFATFLEFTEADVLDPDIAVQELEHIAESLRHLNSADRNEFVSQIRKIVDEARLSGESAERLAFLENLPENLGLGDTDE